MALEPEFLELMRHTILVEHWDGVSRDESGQPSAWGAAVSYRCRVAGKVVTLRRVDSAQDAIIYDIWLRNHTDAHFREEDRVTLPTELQFRQEYPSIFTIGVFDDTVGLHHVKLQCGWQYHRQGQ